MAEVVLLLVVWFNAEQPLPVKGKQKPQVAFQFYVLPFSIAKTGSFPHG